jgi:hypothetical protein
MGEASLEREIRELREQVKLLADREVPGEEGEEPADDADEDEDLSRLKAKVEDFVGTIQKDLREIPAATAVGIFALGVLVGRLLPR